MTASRPPCEYLGVVGRGVDGAPRHAACPRLAEWSITDMSDFDPTSCTAHSCSVHLSEMLGHHAALPEAVTDVWEVRPL